jgi:hypothetical protein
MQIIAASIEKAADVFLHSGYLSAYPSEPISLDPNAYGGTEILRLDFAEALRLKSEAISGSGSTGNDWCASLLAPFSDSTFDLLVVGLSFFMAMGACYLLRTSFLTWASVLAGRARWAVALASLGVITCGVGTGSSKVDVEVSIGPEVIDSSGIGLGMPAIRPWEGVPIQEYADPGSATVAIMNGLLADAVVNAPAGSHDWFKAINASESGAGLGAFFSEVGLPTKKPTAGEAYALLSFGRDGWGREFRMERGNWKTDEPEYWITSAGPDGEFDSADDIVLGVNRCSDRMWAGDTLAQSHAGGVNDMRWGFWIRKSGGSHVLLFHRWTGSKFVYSSKALAETLTGSALFDGMGVEELPPEGQALAAAAWDSFDTPEDERLVLQVFAPGTKGGGEW